MSIRCCITTACLLVAGLSGLCASAEDVSLTVHPDRVVNRIDEKVYGHFLEHIYHSCNGGLWGELVWDRSFEGAGAGVAWSHQGDCLVQNGAGSDVRLVFGSPQWSDFELTLDACKTGGDEGFLILLRAVNHGEFYWANLGGWQNIGHALERGIKGGDRWGVVGRRYDGRIETDHWYRIRARCEGPRIRVWLDDTLVIDYTDDGRGPARGKVGVGTWSTQAKFTNFKVASLDGKTLFEGLPPIPPAQLGTAPFWQSFGQVSVETSTENPLNGERCKRIESKGGTGGLLQGPVCVRAGETYRGSVWVRGQADDGLSVRLCDGDNVLAEARVAAPSAEWQEFPIELKPAASCDAATLQVALQGAGKIWLDQVSLMPESWAAAGGFRPDLLQAIAELKPPVIRWPGGCFASPYRWKDGIGPQHKRGPHPKNMWDDKEVNSFGTDEFVRFCTLVGAEPYICTNAGSGTIEEMSAWVEYCNLDGAGSWARRRAANGFSDPHGVRYWSIGNENYGSWEIGAKSASEWASLVREAAKSMRAVDPTIELFAASVPDIDWNRELLREAGDYLDWISVHAYWDPLWEANDLAPYDRCMAYTRSIPQTVERTEHILGALGFLGKIKIAVDEWNLRGWHHPVRWSAGEDYLTPRNLNDLNASYTMADAVFTACFLNESLRHSETVRMTNFSPLVNVRGLIYAHREGIVLRPTYHVFSLYAERMTGTVVDAWIRANPEFTVASDAGETAVAALDATATVDPDGGRLHVALVNRHPDRAVETTIEIRGDGVAGAARLHRIDAPSTDSFNDVDAPEVVVPRAEELRALAPGRFSLTAAPHSINLLELPLTPPTGAR